MMSSSELLDIIETESVEEIQGGIVAIKIPKKPYFFNCLQELEWLYKSNESVRALCDQYSRDYGTLGVSHGMIARVCDQLGIPK